MTDIKTHLTQDVLPWWLEHGIDPELGGVMTCWNNAGTELISTDKYTWSQGRWAWLMSRLVADVEKGWLELDAEALRSSCLSTAAFIKQHCILDDLSTVFVVDRAGTPKPTGDDGDLHASVFADLFAAMGFAGAAAFDSSYGADAVALYRSAAERIRGGNAKTEPYPVPPGRGSLALPMMLIGSGSIVADATGDQGVAGLVREAGQDLLDRYIDGGDVAEMPGGGANDDTLIGLHRTPGHVLELVWFLYHARAYLPEALTDVDVLEAITLHNLEIGWDAEHGGLFRYTDRNGGQPVGETSDDPYEDLVRRTWDTKLWWPHAEAVYTTRLMEKLTGNPEIAQWRKRVEDWTFATFPEGDGREWTQIRERDGKPMEAVVALPVKDPMHVARSLLLCVELEANA